jgi:hypothetical protein
MTRLMSRILNSNRDAAPPVKPPNAWFSTFIWASIIERGTLPVARVPSSEMTCHTTGMVIFVGARTPTLADSA